MVFQSGIFTKNAISKFPRKLDLEVLNVIIFFLSMILNSTGCR